MSRVKSFLDIWKRLSELVLGQVSFLIPKVFLLLRAIILAPHRYTSFHPFQLSISGITEPSLFDAVFSIFGHKIFIFQSKFKWIKCDLDIHNGYSNILSITPERGDYYSPPLKSAYWLNIWKICKKSPEMAFCSEIP